MIDLPKASFFTSIDIGSRYIKGLVLRKHDQEWEALAYSSVKSRGLDEGEIKDAIAFKESVNTLLKELEEQIQRSLRSDFIISFSNVNFERRDVVSEKDFGEDRRVINLDILGEMQSEALGKLEEDGKKPLHLFSKRYLLDGERIVFNPLDMKASKITVEYTSIVIPVRIYEMFYNFLQDIVKSPFQLRSSLVSTAEGVLTSSEKDRGVVVLNLGYNFTGLIAYKNGVPIKIAYVPVGMKHVIKDVSAVLDTSFEEAERLIITYGNAVYSDIKEEEIQYRGLDGNTVKTTNVKKLAVIIHARLREIMSKSKKVFREVEAKIMEEGEIGIPGGVVLSGGGAKIPRINDLATEVFRVPVRTGCYANSDKPLIVNSDEAAYDPSFAAAFGNVFSSMENPYEEAPVKRENPFKRIFRLFRELME
ncbi:MULTISPECIES: cell division protein FtsA [Thermotoga]|uniref:Cell division protein FtsA n=1 Tax=Thermotoga neapolitana (strain ATCC 49049 / DSM 4359 / NBRC 107923 / NS-E) TaxID=309803 RepID=B9KAD4_THENN|nr:MULTISPECIES: cell division protein FtsA [Thermotoga]ACM23917.1 Cell division protein FtsA [Thermotoga neapolitana DSM 4359]HBF10671.1 cell division protein FtsA [Thermotoga neapolitana]